VPPAGPCSDNDDEDCDDVASGSNVELDVEINRLQSSTSAPASISTESTRRSTSHHVPTSLLTVQLPPREASVFLEELDPSGTDREDVVLYQSGSRFSTSLGMNIGLIAGIAAGIIILTLIVAYAVCKYRRGRIRRLGRAARCGKAARSGKDAGVAAETVLLSGGVGDHERRKPTTPLLYHDPTSNYPSQKTSNGVDSDMRRKRKDVNEWYV